jgi:hypothetical protein
MEVDDFSSVKKETSWHINPEISAVLVIDMLNDFLVEGGKMFLPGGGSYRTESKNCHPGS